MAKYAQALLWVDLETSGLDKQQDQILELAAVVTDFDLNEYAGYHEVIAPTHKAAERLRAAPSDVLTMHRESGLLREWREATVSLAEAEREVIQMLATETAFEPGEFAIAGSGVATFDLPLIHRDMPELAKWLIYYPYDTGVFRRLTAMYTGGKQVFPSVAASYKDGAKKHRALADVQAHIEEARVQREWVRSVM